MPFVFLAVLIPLVLANSGLLAVRVLQLLEAVKRSPDWWGHVIYVVVFTANAIVMLVLYTTYSLHLWTY